MFTFFGILRRSPLAWVTAGVLGLSACNSGAAPERTWIEDGPVNYVALGDSFTSGAGISPVTIPNCGQSRRNYPHLVADRFSHLKLTDVSCAGASTKNLDAEPLQGYETPVPVQFEAVTAKTDLITLSIGANDLSAYGTVVGDCAAIGHREPQGFPCTAKYGNLGGMLADSVSSALTRQLGVLQSKAPEARIVLVGYPQVVPFNDTCPALPLAEGDILLASRVNEGMNEGLRRAAVATGVEYLNTSDVSQGHDMCSSDPWINEADPKLRKDPLTDGQGDYAHPRPDYHEAVAEKLSDLLATSPPK